MKFVSRGPWFVAAAVLLGTLAPVLPAQAARPESTTFSEHKPKVKVHRAESATLAPATTNPQFADAPVAAATTPTASFLVTYDAGFNANPAAKAAFQAAVDIWARLIASPVPIRVNASFANLGGGGAGTVLGQAGPGILVRDFPGARFANTWYPLALAESLYGGELSTDYTEIEATFNSNPAAGFYFGTDRKPPFNQVDFESVVLHELGHGLGNIGGLEYGGSCGVGRGCFNPGPMVYDRFTRTSTGTWIDDITSPSTTLGAIATAATGVFFDGAATNLVGGPARLLTPNPFDESFYSHLDNSWDGTADSLMTPGIAAGEISNPRQLILGMFKDMGYQLAPAALYQPLKPARIWDTRTGVGSIGGNATMDVPATGVGAVPASGVGAVVLNVTVTETTTGGHMTVWPTGQAKPLASNLNFGPGQTVANAVIAKVGAGGKVSFYNSTGPAHLVVDVAGWIPSAAAYTPLTPARVRDTRSGAPIGESQSIDVSVTGVGGVPASGVGAVALNVTATEPSSGGYFTVWPTGQTRPVASNLNFYAGQTAPNLVIAKVGSNGKVSIYNAWGTTHAVVDVQGWFPADADYTSLTPSRLLDTRATAAVGPAGTIQLPVLGRGGVPTSGVAAVVLNVTATEPTAFGYLTVWPAGQTRPLASNLNFTPGQTVPNLVIAKVGSGGTVQIYNAWGSTHIVVDMMGYYV